MSPRKCVLPDGRLSFSHGPIDLIIHAEGTAAALRASESAAWRRFETLLEELTGELAELRRPVGEASPLRGVVARRMWQACRPFRSGFITPMAAVAGAVAQEVASAYDRAGILRAAVNNGGDIALHLAPGQSYRLGVCSDLARACEGARAGTLRPEGTVRVDAGMPVRGVATSGWRGRSFSLGIADSVTVLAATAAQADAAATVIANAVNVDDRRIGRAPASTLKDDTDLGDLMVTTHVPVLEPMRVRQALAAGVQCALRLRAAGLIHDALLGCQGLFAGLRPSVPAGEPALLPGRFSVPSLLT